MMYHKFKEITKFEIKDLHEKIGQIIVMEPTDSDINEGNFMEQVWFVDRNATFYLLSERDTRKPKDK